MKKILLPNGLRILLCPTPKAPTATVLVLVQAGSEYEQKNNNGISHFLEHLVFKGTTNRPTAALITSELDGLGAQYNAFTGQEYTGYWAKVQAHKASQAFDLISDLYLNPIFNEAELEKERGVIIEEINMYEDTPTRRIHEYFSQLLYGDQPAGWDIAGEKHIIRSITRDQVMQYRAAHYVAPATVVVVSGGFSPEKMLSAIKSRFGGLKRSPVQKKAKTRESQSSPAVFLKHKESDQSHLVLGVRAFSMFDRRRYTAQVLSSVLGGGMSSRLFQRVREELGAAYYVRASSDLMIDHGFLAVSAGVDHKKINEVIVAILDELQKLKDSLVSEAELRKTKDHLIGNFLIGLESSDELASFYGGQEITHEKLLSPEEVIKNIETVTAAQLRALASTLFVNNRLNLAVLGPYSDSRMFKKITRFS